MKNNSCGIIYKITNLVNGKIYIGQTTRLMRIRFKEHCEKDKGYLNKSIRKHGKDKFSVTILCKCSSIKELNKKEEYYIKKLKSIGKNGYNILKGGRNKTPAPSTILIWSKQRTGSKNPMFGKKRPKKVRDAISKAKTGVPMKEDIKIKISRTLKGRKMTKIHRSRISKSLKGKKKSSSHIKNMKNVQGIAIICNETGRIFSSILSAAKIYGVDPGAIRWALSKKYRTCKKHTFEYL